MKSLLIIFILLGSSLSNACAMFSIDDEAMRGRTRVTFWHGMESGINNKILQAKIDEFNRTHTDIYIDAQIYGAADQLSPKLDAAVAGKTPPDLLWWAAAFFPKYAEAGALRAVDDLMAQDTGFDKSDVYDYLWEMATYENKIYVTPFSANNLGIYFNKSLFREAGLNEQAAMTWDEFQAAARHLQATGRTGFQVPVGSAEWTVWTWQCFLWSAGGELLSADKRHAAFNSEAGIAALDFWKALLRDGAAMSETDAGYKIDDFLAKRVAMTINGPWNYPLLQKQTAVECGVMPMPVLHTPSTNIGGEALFLFKSNDRTERAAWEFMKFVMSPDFQIEWAMNTGYLPISKTASGDARYQTYLAAHPFMKTFNDQMPTGKTRPSIPKYPAVSATLGKYLEAALYGKYDARVALDKAAAEVNRLLAEDED